MRRSAQGLPGVILACGLAASLARCAPPPGPLDPLPDATLVDDSGPRVSGRVGSPNARARPQVSYSARAPAVAPGGSGTSGGGDIALDFADTDVREVAAQILGGQLQVNYTIDPAVHGTVSFRSAQPLTRGQLIPTLQVLLAQAGAALQQNAGIYRVVPAAGGAGLLGSQVIPLRYASAETLAKILQPIVAATGRIEAEPGRNALVISGDPAGREALADLVRSFDVDLLAGQSYAVLPVTTGSPKDFATALLDAFRAQGSGALASLIRVVPLTQVDSVLVVASQPRYIDEVRRVYGLIERTRRETVRTWHVLYLQNSSAMDVAYVLQQAFTPNNVTAQPSPQSGYAQQARTGGLNASGGASSGGAPGAGGGLAQSSGAPDQSGTPGLAGLAGSGAGAAPSGLAGSGSSATSNPLLGGLDAANANGAAEQNAIRIVPNTQNNALLAYATAQEEDTIESMLRKIDLLPLQVQIDATIAEVDLNDALQYGTQFFFKSGGINGILSNASQSFSASNLTAAAFATASPGFVIGGNGLSGAPLAISALQSVSKVRVLSSPQIMVLDNQPAKLQVGSLVPYLTGSATSTLVSGAPIVNSVSYRETGVILRVTPRVSNTGLVTLDISQEVSAIDNAASQQTALNSPTFSERNVISRVVVQDGQTVGLAGLITDNETRSNSGLPWLKDIPLLGFLAGTQDNSRVRTELLVLITPHVIHNQRDVRAFAESMRTQLSNAAAVPQDLQTVRASGSEDPQRPLRRRLGLDGR